MKFALEGVVQFFKSERNGQIEGVIAVIVIAAGFYFNIDRLEWIAVLLCIGGVLTAEALNTAIEKLCDVISQERDARIKLVKDISAGAVLLMSIASSIIGLKIFIPRIIILLIN